MITQFRKSASNIFIKLLLWLIVLSFVGIGAVSFIRGNSAGDVVTFSHIEPITMEEFQHARSNLLKNFQDNMGGGAGMSMPNEQLVNQIVLQSLITKSLTEYLASLYDLDISEHKIVDLVKQDPVFQNETGQFEIDKFKIIFRNNPALKQDYIAAKKHNIIKSILLHTFSDSFFVSDIQLDNAIKRAAEKRVVDIVSIDLGKTRSDSKIETPSNEELQNYYKARIADFTTSEERSFSYIKLDKKFIDKKLVLSDKVLREFFQENVEEFNSDDFEQVKKDVKEAYQQTQELKLFSEIQKNLEDDVASGMTLEEVANKYEVKIQKAANVTSQQTEKAEKAGYLEAIETIFEMEQGEISYPIEIQDKYETILTRLDKIIPSRVKPFEEVKEIVIARMKQMQIMEDNYKYLSRVQEGYDPSKRPAQNKDIEISSNFTISKYQLLNDSAQNYTLPDALLEEIMQTSAKHATGLHVADNKAYFAYVSATKETPALVKKIKQNAADSYLSSIKEGVYQELMQHLFEENQVQINLLNPM